VAEFAFAGGELCLLGAEFHQPGAAEVFWHGAALEGAR